MEYERSGDQAGWTPAPNSVQFHRRVHKEPMYEEPNMICIYILFQPTKTLFICLSVWVLCLFVSVPEELLYQYPEENESDSKLLLIGAVSRQLLILDHTATVCPVLKTN